MRGEDWQSLLEQASRLRQSGRIPEAIAAYERLLALQPSLPDSWYNLGWLYRQARRFDEALAAYARALELGVRAAEEVHLNRAVILSDHLAQSDSAMSELHSALALNPGYVPALLNLGNLHEDRGEQTEARDVYSRALDVDPANCLALARLAGVSGEPKAVEMIARLRRRLGEHTLDHADRADLGFALGRLLDRSGDYDSAFAAYSAANAAHRESAGGAGRYDPAAHEQLIDRIIAAFPAPGQPRDATAAEPPLFIVGMFRSGSTLVEQILAGHSRIHAAGELDLIPTLVSRLKPYPEAAAQLDDAAIEALRREYLRGLPKHPPSQRITDKRPDNFLHVGLIKRLFPEAKIIHTVRQPLDNLLSLYSLQLDPLMSYAHDLRDAAHWYAQYRRLMAHWRELYPDDIIDVDYDALVAEPRPAIERVVDFLQLPWEEQMLDFHEHKSVVKTASVWQVRQPLYRQSSGRWRNYARQLQPIKDSLDQADAT